MAGADLRLGAALAAGKVVGGASRLLGLGGGTTLPGDVARWADPGILEKLARRARRGSLLITGTNGKTSTAAMVRATARAMGWRVGGNSSGSNLLFGLTASVLDQTGLNGSLLADALVLEVDELSSPQAVREVRPAGLVLLNLFRDQLDRSFEVEQIAARMGQAIAALPAESFTLANADDPRVVQLSLAAASGRQVRFFGIDDPYQARATLPDIADARLCPRCRGELVFSQVYYGHCGHYHCPTCGLERPRLDYAARELRLDGLGRLRMRVAEAGTDTLTEVAVELGGIYNAANAVAAFGAARCLGIPATVVADALASFLPAFGRSQVAVWEGVPVRLMLAKNPSGLEESMRAVLQLERPSCLALALNDGVADGRDISWIWDADLEMLAADGPETVVVSGSRSRDLLLRLAYAGLAEDRLLLAETPRAALDALRRLSPPQGAPAPALLTYTAMFAWHRELARTGAVSRFWDNQ